jgi:hypothetical protein
MDDLIIWLRGKQEILRVINGVPNHSKSIYLRDFYLTASGGVFLEKMSKNEYTNMLTRLSREKPDLFVKDCAVNTSVNNLCAKLRKLAQENVILELTEENIIILINGLKSRLLKLWMDKESNGNTQKFCIFRDLEIRSISGLVVEGVGYLENEFTQLLGILMEKIPELININHKNIDLGNTSLKPLYDNLNDLIRKPLTNEDLIYLINGLEIRKAKFMEDR